jgi:hypothetical protein
MNSLWECAMLAAGVLTVYFASHMLFPDNAPPPRNRSSDYFIIESDDEDDY